MSTHSSGDRGDREPPSGAQGWGGPPPPGHGSGGPWAGDTGGGTGGWAGGRPGAPGLRPLNLGDVLDRMFRLLIENWRTYLLALGVILVPVSVVSAFAQQETTGGVGMLEMFQNPASAEATMAARADLTSLAVANGALYLLSLVTTPLLYGIACVVAAAGQRGERPGPGETLRAAARRYWSLLALVILTGVLTLLLFAPGVGLAVAGGLTQQPPLLIIGVILALLAIPAAVALFTYLLFGIPVAVVERTGPVRALKRSVQLVRGRFWPILGTIIVAGIIAGIVSSVLSLVFVGPAALFGGALALVLNAVGSLVSGVISTPLLINAQTVMYYDSRVRKEGLDLQDMASRLGADQPWTGGVTG